MNTGYDRIYVVEGDRLFVALNERGPVDDVRPFYRAQMRHDHRREDFVRFETSIRCIPFPDQIPEGARGEGRCLLTGGHSAQRVVMAKAY